MKTLLIFSAGFLVACAEVPERPILLSERIPEVLYVSPGTTEGVPDNLQWVFFFSEPLAEETVGPDSVLLSQGEVASADFDSPADLLKAVDSEKFLEIPLHYWLTEEGRVLVVTAEGELVGGTYTFMVTPRVLSVDHIPVPLFLASYQNEEVPHEGGGVPPPLPSPVSDHPAGHGPIGSPPPASNDVPESIPTPDLTPVEEEDPEPGPLPETAPILEEEPPPNEAPMETPFVVLNEIYYDAVGSDTDGLLFVELFGTPGFEIGSYRINFVDGGDGSVDDSITLPENTFLGPDGFYLVADAKTGSPNESNVPEANLIDNFDPQNGPDAVQLLDQDGMLVDVVAYGLSLVEGSSAPDVVNGHSLERQAPGLDTDNNAADFVDREVPTPGN